MGISLEQLDRKTVAVELTIAGEVRILRGVGNYVHDEVLGDSLRIALDDPDSQTEILLRKSEWAGPIVLDDQHGCDYRIRLGSVCSLP
ncbi:MAG TPA: hypothetical protein VMP01_21415 [Pirellulaceae bacterium]|nr:hypothetical protein [Pirellulaceae bacterium]